MFTEVLAFCAAGEGLRKAATMAVRHLLSVGNVRVIPQSRESFLDGLALYEARPDKGYSLTDCISMETMQARRTDRRSYQGQAFRAGRLQGLFR